jgi:hypothetical protein
MLKVPLFVEFQALPTTGAQLGFSDVNRCVAAEKVAKISVD